MRPWISAAFVGLLATPAIAQDSGDSTVSFRERLNSCVGTWKDMPTTDRGTMTYRQYTAKCVSGKPAAPIKASALCRNGSTASAAAPEGACANEGGVAHWVN
jgi:hypothetical protein